METTDSDFDKLHHIGITYNYDVEPLVRPMGLYLEGHIDDESILQLLQWVPEDIRIKIWDSYKIC